MTTVRVKYWIDRHPDQLPQVAIGEDELEDLQRAYEEGDLISLGHCINVKHGMLYRIVEQPKPSPTRDADYDVEVVSEFEVGPHKPKTRLQQDIEAIARILAQRLVEGATPEELKEENRITGWTYPVAYDDEAHITRQEKIIWNRRLHPAEFEAALKMAKQLAEDLTAVLEVLKESPDDEA